MGEDINLTIEDLLKVPSLAPRDVFVTANAIYKDMKENSGALPDEKAILTQFGTIDAALGADATAKDFEVQVVGDLVQAGNAQKVSKQDIFEFEQKLPDAVVPELAQALLQNNIVGLVDGILTFNADYTVVTPYGTTTWSVEGTKLIINGAGGDREEYTFASTSPADNSIITKVGYYGDSIQYYDPITIIVTEPVVVTPPTTGGGDTAGSSLPDLSGYSVVNIYKNLNQTTATNLMNLQSSNSNFGSQYISANCSDFGFTSLGLASTPGTALTAEMSYYSDADSRSCVENDYKNSTGVANLPTTSLSGNVDLIVYY